MVTVGIVVAAVALVVSLPYWLPRVVVALRMRIFARINGSEGIPVPGPEFDVADWRALYEHPAADGRSRGAGLSDLFWYWLAPGPEVHQEHLEPGERYEQVARTTRRFLARPKPALVEITRAAAESVLSGVGGPVATVRLRDTMMPIWAEVYHRLVFDEACPPGVRNAIVANADDVITALKCCGLRHLDRRDRLTDYLLDRVRHRPPAQPLPDRLSELDQARYLQGAFFNTAIVQMSEAMAHLLLAIAQHPAVRRRLVADPEDDDYLDRVIDESLRRYPLFGIAHRITSADIDRAGSTVPAGSVLCFSYPDFHAAGLTDADVFDPDRWERESARSMNFLPFGVTANRPCPARGVAPVTMRVVVREVLARYLPYSSAAHTRSVPNRGPCLLVSRDRFAAGGAEPGGPGTAGSGDRPVRPGHDSPAVPVDGPVPGGVRARLALMRLRDRWEDVSRSLVQLVLGSYLVADARRQGLARTYFATHDTQGRPRAGGCPVTGGER